MNKFKKIYKFCRLLKIDGIKEELNEQIKGYSLNSIEQKNNEWICSLKNEEGHSVAFIIGFNTISIIKSSKNKLERILIDETLLLINRTIEKRTDGILYSVMEKQFNSLRNINNKVLLFSLTEDRYVLTRYTLEKYMNNFNFDKDSLGKLFLNLCSLENNGGLKDISDYYSVFSTHINKIKSYKDNSGNIDNIIFLKTYINGEEVSDIFNLSEGLDKVYRVFDLYQGVINYRNEKDIDLINQGQLLPDAYDLKGLSGITKKEEDMIGKPLIGFSDEYINYLKKLFYDKFRYENSLQLDRGSILKAITYKVPGQLLVKKDKFEI